jgi:hypothetical protein
VNLSEFGLEDVRESVTEGGIRLISASFPPGHHDEVWRALRQAHDHTGLWPVLSWNLEPVASETFGWPQPQGQVGLAEALTIGPAEQMDVLVHAAYEDCVEDYGPDEHESLAYWRDAFDPDVLARRLEPVSVPPSGIRRVERQSAPT